MKIALIFIFFALLLLIGLFSIFAAYIIHKIDNRDNQIAYIISVLIEEQLKEKFSKTNDTKTKQPETGTE